MPNAVRKCRRFNLGDGMILIAATAAGFGVLRQLPREVQSPSRVFLTEILLMTFSCLVAITLSLPIIRFRRPRPPLPRMMRQPGLFACITVALVVATDPLLLVLYTLKNHPHPRDLGRLTIELFLELVPPTAGFVVLISWGLLALSGRWRREHGWIDGIATLLGVCWVALSILWVYLVQL